MANAFPENRFTFVQKNSEWQIAIPRSLNNISFQKENANLNYGSFAVSSKAFIKG